jgi:hypothetical protein
MQRPINFLFAERVVAGGASARRDGVECHQLGLLTDFKLSFTINYGLMTVWPAIEV